MSSLSVHHMLRMDLLVLTYIADGALVPCSATPNIDGAPRRKPSCGVSPDVVEMVKVDGQ